MIRKKNCRQKTVRNRSRVGAGELTLVTGMTLWEYRQRSGRVNGLWFMISAVGLSTYGALAGIRASSFPNPVLAPPQPNKSSPETRERSAFGSLTIGAGNIVITGDCEIYDKHF